MASLRFPPTHETIAFVVASSLVVAGCQVFLTDTPVPVGDALRYLNYALNIHLHNVFGLSADEFSSPPVPGMANAPLYPLLVAVALGVFPGMRSGVECLLVSATPDVCSVELQGLVALQCTLVVITLLSVWLTCQQLSSSRPLAWLTAAAVLWSGEPLSFANTVLTERLTLTLFSCSMYLLVSWMQTGSNRCLALLGVMLGLLVLTRAEFVYLFYGISLALIATLAARSRGRLTGAALSLAVGFALATAPWLVRNSYTLGVSKLTDGYADAILVQRVAYNRMSWPEFGVFFIYWFPDIGDSIARRSFNPELYQKLTFAPGSYYTDDSQLIMREALSNVDQRSDVLRYLLEREVIENFPKHVAVTFALLWRGMFVAKYWGVLGVGCFLITMFWALRQKRWVFVLSCVPPWFMAGFYAFVSVSIPRYDIVLIPIYAMSMALVLSRIAGRQIDFYPSEIEKPRCIASLGD